MTLGLFRRSFSPVPLAAALLLSSFAANADMLTGTLAYAAPQGVLPVLPFLSATGSGSFSFSSDLVAGLADNASIVVNASNLTGFNLTVQAMPATASGSPSAQATYTFTLSDLTDFSAVIVRNGDTFHSPSFGLGSVSTSAVSGNIPDYGTAMLFGSGSSVATESFRVSNFNIPDAHNPLSGPYSAAGTLGITNNGILTSSATPTPEPASFLLAAPALAGLWFMRRKKAA